MKLGGVFILWVRTQSKYEKNQTKFAFALASFFFSGARSPIFSPNRIGRPLRPTCQRAYAIEIYICFVDGLHFLTLRTLWMSTAPHENTREGCRRPITGINDNKRTSAILFWKHRWLQILSTMFEITCPGGRLS